MAGPAPFATLPLFPQLLLKKGKVRDVYRAGEGLLVVVASDRISAFDVVLDPGIPGKGIVLTQLSNFWFSTLAEVAAHHVLATELSQLPEPFASAPGARPPRVPGPGRAASCRWSASCRGYIVGSGWKEYQAKGSVSGVPLPNGLRQAERLPDPVFTPSTKAEVGHDENISFDEVVRTGRGRGGRERSATSRSSSTVVRRPLPRRAASSSPTPSSSSVWTSTAGWSGPTRR